MNNWIQFFSIATNVTVILVGIKLVRHFARLEFKVDIMWDHYIKVVERRLPKI